MCDEACGRDLSYMLSKVMQKIKLYVKKAAVYFMQTDNEFSADLVRNSFKTDIVRQQILEEDMKNKEDYWINLYKEEISNNEKVILLAEEELIQHMDFKERVVQRLYDEELLYDVLQRSVKDDLRFGWQMMDEYYRNGLLYAFLKECLKDRVFYQKVLALVLNLKEYVREEAALKRKVFASLFQAALLGGISSCRYDMRSKVFMVNGWFFPRSNYDRIMIKQGGKILGEAELGIEREDVFQKYPSAAERYAGWSFCRELSGLDCNQEIIVQAYKENTLVFSTTQIPELASIKNLWNGTIDDFSIHIKNAAEDTKEARERMERFHEICLLLQDWMPWKDKRHYDKFLTMREELLFGNSRVEELFVEIFSIDNAMQFKNASMIYQDAYRFWIIINELLINQEYYFETENSSPFIIDCGANVGLAVFYFKTIYPGATIIAFEPSKEIYDILCQNIENNGWSGVQAYPYALDKEEKTCDLLVPKNDCLGASLTSRAFEDNGDIEVVHESVCCKRLSPYVTSFADYLKLDVEGVEVRVLKELGDHLHKIERIFCEFHYGKTVEDNEFSELIEILEKYGFQYQVTKSPGYQKATEKKTMLSVGRRCSFNIWAKKFKKEKRHI